jgi:tRNA pseudouridine13 synthase
LIKVFYNLEHKIGIEVYATKTPGIGGKLRCLIEDFKVEEISKVTIGEKGNFLIAELIKKNWETNLAIKAIAKSLGVSYKRISFAGTKDKRALTKQLISIYNVDANLLQNVKLNGIELKVLGRSEKPIALGNLKGNRFEITIRDIDLEYKNLKERASSINSELLTVGGIPNFFGVQRFGTRRPITGEVGRAILKGDLEKAALIYIAMPSEEEPEEVKAAREHVFNTGDYSYGLKHYPKYLKYERAMMHELLKQRGDFKAAFRVLPLNLRQMFIHACQAIIFNRILSRRIKAGLPLNQALVGDIVCFAGEDGLLNSKDWRLVTLENLNNTNNLIAKGRAFITAPVIGYETPLAEGEPGEIERAVLSEAGITGQEFKVKIMPELSSKGLRRGVLLKADPNFQISIDELNPGKQKLLLNFSLPKGAYATTLLREYMKSKDAVEAGF